MDCKLHGVVLNRVVKHLGPQLVPLLYNAPMIFYLLRHLSSDSKITNFNLGVVIDQYIGRFEISVHKPRRMHEVNRTDKIVQNDKYMVFCQYRSILHSFEYFFQIRFYVLHDKK
jgi:hypothetical protein